MSNASARPQNFAVETSGLRKVSQRLVGFPAPRQQSWLAHYVGDPNELLGGNDNGEC